MPTTDKNNYMYTFVYKTSIICKPGELIMEGHIIRTLIKLFCAETIP